MPRRGGGLPGPLGGLLRPKWDMTGRVVVITGAASGIGRALAVEAGRREAKLALGDVDVEGLEETARQAREAGAPEVHTARVDVSEQGMVADWARELEETFRAIHVVINNAGLTHIGGVMQMEYKDIARVMDVDYWGVVHGSKEFLPALVASGDGHLVNIASLFSIMGAPSQSAYCSAKSAVQGFTETLAMEMDKSGKPVTVTCVHPGGIATNIAKSATAAEGVDSAEVGGDFDKQFLRIPPAVAARIILDGVEKRKRRVLIGAEAYAIDALVRLAPAGYQKLIARFSQDTGLT